VTRFIVRAMSLNQASMNFAWRFRASTLTLAYNAEMAICTA